MPTNKRSLILLTPPPPEPSPELVEHALDLMISNELYDLACSLDLSRQMWRRYRTLVEGPDFPEKLRAVLIDQSGTEPNDDCTQFEEDFKALEPGYRESIRAQAVEVARGWMAKGLDKQRSEEEDGDANFLGELGIAG